MALSPYPAGLGRRLAAAVYDLFLLVGLWMIAGLALLPFTGGHAVDGSNLWVRAYFLFVPWLFFSWFWRHGGQTLGMKAWRIRLRDRDGYGVSWRQTILRYLAAWPSWLSLVGIVWVAFDGQKRALHDIASATEIVVVPKEK